MRSRPRRRRPDHEITPLFGTPLQPNIEDAAFLEAFKDVNRVFDPAARLTRRRRILIATGDVLQPKMAGPAIRAWHIAAALSREHEVRLATPHPCTLEHPDFPVVQADDRSFADLEEWADVIVFQGNLMRQYSAFRHTKKIVVADIYDPFHLEVLEQSRHLEHEARRFAVRSSTEILNEQLMRADFLLCASDKQRDFWLGQLAGVGRINELNYDANERLSSLIAVVPFGIDERPPVATRKVLRGVVPGIGPDDKVILWGGGIYNWFDPLTLLRAVDKLRSRLPNVRVYFLGIRHPNPDVGEMRRTIETLELSDELGLTGTHVFFNDDWVDVRRPPELPPRGRRRGQHPPRPRRDRVLVPDAGPRLPVGRPAGGRDAGRRASAGVIESRGAGLAVPPGDVDALEDALYPRARGSRAERVVPHRGAQPRDRFPLARGARSARRVLPQPGSCSRPPRSRARSNGAGPARPRDVATADDPPRCRPRTCARAAW